MKCQVYLYIILVNFFASCHGSEENRSQRDSSLNVTELQNKNNGNNLVSAEAPDAVIRITQGYALPRFDDGLIQSPINILSDSTLKDSQFNAIQIHAGITAVENLGHTIQLDFQDGSTTTAGGKIYYAKQFHFHTPSEHMIDGMTFPMEMHIVNVLKDSAVGDNRQFLVIALLFKMGHENKFIKEFLDEIPAHEEKDSLPSGTVQFDDLINSIPQNESPGYYSYKGSLTTPPYTETVTWVVKKYILQASPEQITRIEKMEGDNARHVHALYARKVYNN